MPKNNHQAEADDEAIEAHTIDDQCGIAHKVERQCTLCTGANTVWMPFMAGYWCLACHACFDLDAKPSWDNRYAEVDRE